MFLWKGELARASVVILAIRGLQQEQTVTTGKTIAVDEWPSACYTYRDVPRTLLYIYAILASWRADGSQLRNKGQCPPYFDEDSPFLFSTFPPVAIQCWHQGDTKGLGSTKNYLPSLCLKKGNPFINDSKNKGHWFGKLDKERKEKGQLLTNFYLTKKRIHRVS